MGGPREDVTVCILVSACAGIGNGFFGCVLSAADRLKRANGGRHTRLSRCGVILGAVGSTLFGIGSIAGLAFGPVSLVVVTRSGSLLPANALFSQVFGLRRLVRDDYLGTLVTVSGVVCFSLFARAPNHKMTPEGFREYILALPAFCWLAALGLAQLVSFWWLLHLSRTSPANSLGKVGAPQQRGELHRAVAATLLTCCSSAFMDVAAKGWSATMEWGVNRALQSGLFWAAFGVNALFLCVMRVATIYGCRRCDVLLFVPLNTALNIFLSVATGMIVMQEWRVVNNWVGLACSAMCVLGGIVMLVSGPADGPGARAAGPADGRRRGALDHPSALRRSKTDPGPFSASALLEEAPPPSDGEAEEGHGGCPPRTFLGRSRRLCAGLCRGCLTAASAPQLLLRLNRIHWHAVSAKAEMVRMWLHRDDEEDDSEEDGLWDFADSEIGEGGSSSDSEHVGHGRHVPVKGDVVPGRAHPPQSLKGWDISQRRTA